jgi:hypothetical protein
LLLVTPETSGAHACGEVEGEAHDPLAAGLVGQRRPDRGPDARAAVVRLR